MRIRWDGTTSEGRPARNGRYSFRIGRPGATAVAARASTSTEPINLGFALYGYAFPILGAHDFGGPRVASAPAVRATPTRART